MILVFQMKTTAMSTLLVVFLMMRPILMMKISKVKVINISDWIGDDHEIGKEEEKKVTVGLLLPRHFPHPDDLAYHSRLDSVLPGVVLAAQDLHKILPGWSWDIMVGDTDCNSSTGPHKAMDMFYKNRCFYLFIYKVVISSFQARCIPWASVSLCVVTCQ